MECVSRPQPAVKPPSGDKTRSEGYEDNKSSIFSLSNLITTQQTTGGEGWRSLWVVLRFFYGHLMFVSCYLMSSWFNGCPWIFNRLKEETSTQSYRRRRKCDLLLSRMTSEASAGNADDKMTELALESASVSVDDEATEMTSPPHPSVPVLQINIDKWVQ